MMAGSTRSISNEHIEIKHILMILITIEIVQITPLKKDALSHPLYCSNFNAKERSMIKNVLFFTIGFRVV